MASERKKLLIQRAILEKNLNEYRQTTRLHEQALIRRARENWGILLLIITPIFILGWKLAGEKKITRLVNPVLKFGAMALVNAAKEQILSAKE
ncbi:hypothetical protein [Legionella sp. CNM-4043-24]|uniref:hypothetical protein n=1 Tax=Legionella sp. CNM-4043-24 TaxID=3421646 RepID=UPI00403AA1C3